MSLLGPDMTHWTDFRIIFIIGNVTLALDLKTLAIGTIEDFATETIKVENLSFH